MHVTFILMHIHVVSSEESAIGVLTQKRKIPHNMKKYSEKCLTNPIPWNPWKYLNLMKICEEVDFMIKKDTEIIDTIYLKTSIFLRHIV